MTEQFVGRVGDGRRMAVIAICVLTEVHNKAYSTHLQFAYRLAKDNPDFQFLLFTPWRMTIANFRSMAAKAALDSESEFLMFIDDDAVLIDHNASLFKLLREKIENDENKHIISPVTYVRGYPFEPMFFKWVKDPDIIKEGVGLDHYRDFKEQPVDDKGLLEVAAIGCHTCLIKTEVFKGIEEPYFMTGMHNTEDVYFCMKCHDYIKNIGIYVDTTIHSSHLLDPLYVNDYNVETMREFYKKLRLMETIDWPGVVNFQPARVKAVVKEIGEDFEE